MTKGEGQGTRQQKKVKGRAKRDLPENVFQGDLFWNKLEKTKKIIPSLVYPGYRAHPCCFLLAFFVLQAI
jgi:hypothetical protein